MIAGLVVAQTVAINEVKQVPINGRSGLAIAPAIAVDPRLLGGQRLLPAITRRLYRHLGAGSGLVQL